LDREAFEETAFVSNLERILVAADDSPNGIFAARIAGLIAGSRGMPVRGLKVVKKPGAKSEGDEDDPGIGTLSQAPESAAGRDTTPTDVDVVAPKRQQSIAEALEAEADKGFDFLIIGVNPTTGPKGGFHRSVSQMARAFPGSIAVVTARGPHERDSQNAPINAL